MKKPLTVLALSLTPLLVAATLQKRAAKNERNFEGVVSALQKNWKAGNYGLVVRDLKEGLKLATVKLHEQIRASLTAPEGYELVPDRNAQNAANNPFLAGMSAAVGDVITANFKATQGNGRLTLTVTANSPLVSMINMMLANPAMIQDGELIEYENGHTALLKKEGRAHTLQVLVNKKHVIEGRVQNDEQGEEVLFAALDQAVVDGLAKMLGR